MKSFIRLFNTTIKTFARDRILMFFTLMFPLMFGVLFGVIFGQSGQDYSTKVGVLRGDKDLQQVLSTKREVRLVKYEDEKSMKEAVIAGDVPTGMVLKGKQLYSYQNKVSTMFDPFVSGLAADIRERLSTPENLKDFGIGLQMKPVQSGQTKTNNNALLFPGLLAVSLFSSGVFSSIELFARYREDKILKRLQVTSLRPYTFILSSLLGRMVVSLASAVILYAILSAMFRIQFSVNWPLFFASLVLGSLLMLALGMLISISFKSVTAAMNIATAVMTVMFFFAGIYFPIDFLPKTFRYIAQVMPLYHLANTLRMAMGVEKVIWSYIYTEFAIITLVFVFLTLISAKLVFKKE